MGGLACTLQNNTLIEWWKPISLCLSLAVALGLLLRRATSVLLNLKSPLLNYIIATLFALAVTTGAFYSINYFYSYPTTQEQYLVKVIGKYSQERHRSRRVGRGNYVRGEKYMVYYMALELPDGRRKDIGISAGEYVKTRVGAEIRMSVETGALGVPVIKDISRPSKNKRRADYQLNSCGAKRRRY